MAKKIFTDESLATFVDEIKAYTDGIASSKVDKVTGKGLSTNDYTTTEKNKLSGIASGAQVNQNAFSNIAVSGQTTVAADTTTDTVTFAGSNVTITTDATNDKVTFSVADGSTSAKGLVQLTNSTSSTSTTTAATPSSVKSAYDLANTAKTNAATAQTRADAAYTLAEGKVDSLSDLGITATTAELNYVDGVTSNIQTQLDELNAAKQDKIMVVNFTEDSTSGYTADKTVAEIQAFVNTGGHVKGMKGAQVLQLYMVTATVARFSGTWANKVYNYNISNTGTVIYTETPIISVDEATATLKPVRTTGTSYAYTATISGITALTVGTTITIVPHVVSASTAPTLDVNGLGAKQIRRRLSSIVTAPQGGYSTTWLAVNKPFTLVYDGTYWVVEGLTKPVAADLYGTLAVDKGGTGATDAATARTNLGIDASVSVFIATYGTTTNAEIEAAHQAGKVVLCNYNNIVFAPLTLRASNVAHYFYSPSPSGTNCYMCVGDIWTASEDKTHKYSTTDLTAGTSALETGRLYFVYE